MLVVDDDKDHRRLTIATLQRSLSDMYSLRFSEAATGREALARLERGGINLVMLDYLLPDITGLEVLRELHKRHETAPVLLVTSSNEREVMLEAMKLGASDFLTKEEMDRARLVQCVRGSLERAQLRADVMRTQKLAAIGTLAGGIAHEFNNILQVVLGHSQYALTREDPERWQKALKYCHDAADKGARIVRQLLTFARKGATMHMSFRLDRAVAEAVQLDEEAARRDGVEVQVAVRARPKMLGDSAQIVQVLLNFLTNARHACTSMVTTRAQLQPRILVTVDAQDGMARVSVTDNGVGIPPDVMRRLFEPFYTTKGSLGGRVYDGKSSGTGLGLAISASIAESHGGRIDVTSSPGEGSTFSLVLPVAPQDEFKTPVPATRQKHDSGPLDVTLRGRRVLIVDDEVLIAELLAQYLQEKGLTCDVASDAATARDFLGKHDYDLLLLDLTLPGESGGLDLLVEARAQGGPNAAASALAMTGHAPEAEDEHLFDAGFRGIVRKPFEVRELGRLISESLRVTLSA